MIQFELTDEEAKALLKLLISSTNGIIAAGDEDGMLEHYESLEEKIIGAMDSESIANAKVPVVSAEPQ